MRILSDAERLEIATAVMDEQAIDEYAAKCKRRECIDDTSDIIEEGLIKPNTQEPPASGMVPLQKGNKTSEKLVKHLTNCIIKGVNRGKAIKLHHSGMGLEYNIQELEDILEKGLGAPESINDSDEEDE